MTETKYQNQHTIAKQIHLIRSPRCEVKILKDFPLERIPVMFHIPDFERVKSATHIKGIKESIINNTFFDNVIRVVPHEKSDYFVTDGQHRLAALYLLYTEYGLKTYDLVVIVYDAVCARNVYRKINVGKALSVAAHLKALDDKRVKFFNDLRDHLAHDDHTHLWTFKEALECLYVAKTSKGFLGQRNLEDALSKVVSSDIQFIIDFNKALIGSNPTKQRGLQFKPQFLRHCFGAAYRRRLNSAEIGMLISKGLGSNKILSKIDTYTAANQDELKRLFDELAGESLL